MRLDHPAQRLAAQQREVAVEHQDAAVEPAQRRRRGQNGVPGAARLELHGELHARPAGRPHVVGFGGDHHHHRRNVDGAQHAEQPRDDRAPAELVHQLRPRRPEARAAPGRQHDGADLSCPLRHRTPA